MKKTNLVLMFLGILLIPNLVFAQAKDVYKSLKKIQAMVEVGTNYKDYINALQDAQLEINLFKEGEGKNKKELLNLFEQSFLHYKMAMELWDHKMKVASLPYMRGQERKYIGTQVLSSSELAAILATIEDPRLRKMTGESYRENEKEYKLGRKLLDLYPEAGRFEKDGGAMHYKSVGVNIEKLMDFIWRRADEDIKKISELITK